MAKSASDVAWRTAERVVRQRERIAKLDARIGELMSKRADEEERLAAILQAVDALASK